FVDLEKKGKEQRFHFDDFFEGDFFHWDSQTTQHINTPKIKEIISGSRIPYLFIRVSPRIKNETQPFVYCGRLKYDEYEKGTSKPVHIIFQNIDYLDNTTNENLIEVYTWKPGKIGKTTKSKISKKGVISSQRIRNYKKPDKTERSGLVTSRVGQGYYRQLIREKWNNRCPVTGCEIIKILISSHIVPWSECNENERLDVENGILLSPNVDSLFDKHLISFSDEGEMLLSDKISEDVLTQLGIHKKVVLPVSHGMKKYLKRHREIFYQ
ncbi:DUF3427 domain-containing protein, partial [Flavobacteriales bacterium]|nr:DUF3427 domain-containing protein [Flavobacteriales bacterium]